MHEILMEELANTADKVELVVHMRRKAEVLGIPESFRAEVYEDMEILLKREFALTWENHLEKRHLFMAHELIDCYQLPVCLTERISCYEKPCLDW